MRRLADVLSPAERRTAVWMAAAIAVWRFGRIEERWSGG
jgi:hypothetical protein